MGEKPDIAVVGLGYVGLTLAVTLADLGFSVWGFEREKDVVAKLKLGQSHIFEPGLSESLQAGLGGRLRVESHLPENFSGIVIICVSTPVGAANRPNLANLEQAAEYVSDRMADGSLLIVRSTVPVGTCRQIVLPPLAARHREPRLAYCPERTIQGRALSELRQLPQIVGGLEAASAGMAEALWREVTPRVVRVSSLEAAEMVKLVNNCHTDVLYSFGNEVAMMSHRLGIDPVEVIRAANLDYPRPDLARPGFVAGPCMTKDPYLLFASLNGADDVPKLIRSARAINQELPSFVNRHFLDLVKRSAGRIEGKVFICGFAYKGWPPTDDMRGSPAVAIINDLRRYPLRIYGHDFLVPSETIAACGAIPESDFAMGFKDARAVIFINEHPDYSRLDIAKLVGGMQRPAVFYDCWRMFDPNSIREFRDIHYAAIGYG